MPKYCKSRKSAKKLGRLYYKTGKPCIRDHVSLRYTSTGRCVECDRLYTQSRRNAIILRTPPWADVDAIQKIYDECFDMGPDWTVDHIFPLQADLVSGLHIPENLQIINKHQNLSKQNKFEVV